MTPQHHLPADIERTSISIITRELDELGLTPPPETAAVVKRVIHTTADFDYAKNLRFTPGAVEAAVKALHAGAFIVTDTNMALAGITKPGLKKLNGEAICYMADPAVAEAAKQAGTTRAVAAMHRAAREHPGAILAIGNAPTALLTIAETAAVVKRVIHTTADFDYAKNLRFTPGAVEAAVKALHAGAFIVTDTNMALAGITKPGLKKLNGEAICYMADPAVAEAAKQAGTTRAVAAMHRAAREHPGAILAIGNAPTALLTIAEEMEAGLRPALVIGVPVGFVNVVESKEVLFAACERYGVPAIAAMGRKGGSNVAAAICNALIYSAAEMLDPSARGWNG